MALIKPPVSDVWGQSNTSSPDMATPTYIDTGFPAPGGVPVKPPRGFVNWLFNYAMNGIRYFCARGIADWDTSETEYTAGTIVRAGADDRYYQLVGTATPGTGPFDDPDNWQLWLASPIAKVSDIGREIWAWRNAKQKRVFGIDHFGLPTARTLDFVEDWLDASAVTKTATGSGAWFGRWNYAINNAGGIAGAIYASGPWISDLNTHPWGPLCGVNAFGQSVMAHSIVELAKPLILVGNATIVYETSFSLNNGSGFLSDSTYAFGLGDGTLVSSNLPGNGAPQVTHGAFLWVEPGGTTWKAVSKVSGTATQTDTGIAVALDSPRRYRVVIVGSSDSDDSTARVIHYIDGSVVANHAVAISGHAVSPFVRCAADQGDIRILNVGRLRIQARLELGDVLI